ncbi:MAG TPA: T9SS type A sorting domain-containing protein, partial [Candidatus Kapabacteria bacterium]
KGQLFGLLFCPPRINWEPLNLVPNPFTVEMHLFNPQNGGGGAQNTKLTLRVGDSLTILAPDTVKNNGKTQTQILGLIPPLGSIVARWTVRASESKECTEDLVSSLQFKAESSSISSPIFINDSTGTDTCEHPIIIECANDDQLPPILDPLVTDSVGGKQLTIHDDRATDKGLKSITWKATASTDSLNFMIELIPTLTPCSKSKHTLSIHQKDTTKAGCIEVFYEDCAGHKDDTVICFNAHYPPHIPDTIAPRIYDDTVLTIKKAMLIIADTTIVDTGISQFSIGQPTFGSALSSVDPQIAPCSKLVHAVTITRSDSLHSECIKYTVTDCAGNIRVDSICFTGTLGVRSETSNSVFSILGNPSSGRATIQITLERAQDVTLRIVDALGREVRRVDVKGLSQGENLIPLQTNELVSGTYYVIVEIDGKQFTKSLKVVR